MGVIKKHETIIDEKPYSCETFPATEGLIILPKLISLLGEDVANLIFTVDDEQIGGLLENPKVLAAMMVKISERAAENNGLLVLKDLLKYTRCSAVRVGDATLEASVWERFDSHFAGDYLHLFKVVSWVARASFGNP